MNSNNTTNAEDTSPLMVSIRCITYNHEPYIRQCLEGFVMQKTNFRFEAIVHDDASTDGTADIIREYAEKYPDIIKPILETENQYSKHDGSLNRIMNEACKGKYMAICEGDDYWTDPRKIQLQVDFLESHPDYSAISSNSYVIKEDGRFYQKFSNLPSRDIVDMNEIVTGRKFHTASVLVNMAKLHESIYFEAERTWDTFTWCCCLSQGKIRYEDKITCAYRRGNQGITMYTKRDKWIQKVYEWSEILEKHFYPQYVTYKSLYLSPSQDVMRYLFVDSGKAQNKKVILKQYFKHLSVPIFANNIYFVLHTWFFLVLKK